MPHPGSRESLGSYTKRFMGSGEAKKDFPNVKQRYAVMRSMFRRRKKRG